MPKIYPWQRWVNKKKKEKKSDYQGQTEKPSWLHSSIADLKKKVNDVKETQQAKIARESIIKTQAYAKEYDRIERKKKALVTEQEQIKEAKMKSEARAKARVDANRKSLSQQLSEGIKELSTTKAKPKMKLSPKKKKK